MKKLAWTGAALAALIAVPALALQGGHGGHGDHRGHGGDGARWPTTRAEVQTRTQEMFARFDANKDGQVTRAEFDTARAARKAERQAQRGARRQEMFAKLDTDKNGQLSAQEFATRPEGARGADGARGGHDGKHHRGMGRRGGGMGGGWFERLDGDKNGSVTLAEASAKALQRFDAADTNKDGTLSPAEQQAAREAHRAAWKAKG